MRITFVDANDALSAVAKRLQASFGVTVAINHNPSITSAELPDLLAGSEIAIIDHTHLPIEIAERCTSLKHVVFLGTGPRSYMDPDALAERGIQVHIVKGYGDTAVAECAIALMWASARGLAKMDRGMRAGNWLRTEGGQLTGKTIGLVGFGSIAAEVARIASGIGMKVIAWNRSAKTHPGVEFVSLDRVLADSDVLSLHLTLNDETRGIISRERLATTRPGVILVNTARGALVDEDAMIDALKSGHLAHAGLDVFVTEPMPAKHALFDLDNVTLSAHSAFRTPEANDKLIGIALDHCRRIVGERAPVLTGSL